MSAWASHWAASSNSQPRVAPRPIRRGMWRLCSGRITSHRASSSMLQHSTACCSTVPSTPCRIAHGGCLSAHHSTTCCIMVHRVAIRYNVLQHGTAYCNSVQRAATHRLNMLEEPVKRVKVEDATQVHHVNTHARHARTRARAHTTAHRRRTRARSGESMAKRRAERRRGSTRA
jgi:hypothetical protein